MKKNITINMFGVLYAIDDDACQLLEQYIDNMHRYFDKREGGAEIADDIEHRVAELLSELKDQGVEAVSIEHVQQIIKRIGNPEQMDETADDAESASHDGEASESQTQSGDDGTSAGQEKNGMGARKLYRDPQDKMLGGVMSGLCRYFGCDDPLPWRILMVLLALVSFSTIGIIYLVAWALIPAANTPEDRLRMQGKPVNAQSISEEVMREANRAANYVQSPEFRSAARSFWGTLLSIFVFCVKLLVLLIIGTFIASVLACAVFLAIAYGESSHIGNAMNDSLGWLIAHDAMIGVLGWLGVISSLVFLGTLFYLLVRSLFKSSSTRPWSASTRWALALVCLVTLISSIAFGSLFAYKVKWVKETNPNIYNLSTIPRSVNLLARDGWKLNTAVNINAGDRCVSTTDDFGSSVELPYYKFEKEIDTKPMSLDMERSETLSAGRYHIEAITAADGPGINLFYTERGRRIVTPVLPRLSSGFGNMSTMPYDSVAKLGLFTDSITPLQWHTMQADDAGEWSLQRTPSFDHAGGKLTYGFAGTLPVGADKIKVLRIRVVSEAYGAK